MKTPKFLYTERNRIFIAFGPFVFYIYAFGCDFFYWHIHMSLMILLVGFCGLIAHKITQIDQKIKKENLPMTRKIITEKYKYHETEDDYYPVYF